MNRLLHGLAGLLLAFTLSPTTTYAADEAGVVLTFDDTFVDQWHDYFLNKPVKATFFVSHWHTLSAAQINKLRQLRDQGHEIASHSYDHQGVAGDYNFDPNRIEEYLNEQIIPTVVNMRADGFDPVSYSYPSGERNETYDAAVRTYFPYLRTTFADETKQLFQMDDIFHSAAKNYGVLAGDGIDNSYDNPIAEIEAALMRAKTNNEIVTLYAHRILPDSSPDANHRFGIRVSKLNQVITIAQQMGLKFYTFAEAYQVGNNGTQPPDTQDNITVAVEGNRTNIRWANLTAHDFIGIVPAGQTAWQSNMPGAVTNGETTGKMGITVPSAAGDQQYRAIFYTGTTVVDSSALFTIPGSGDTGGGDTGGGDTGGGDTGGGADNITTVMEGNRVRINWNDMPTHNFIGVVPTTASNWLDGMPGATSDGSASGKMGITAANAIVGQQYVIIFYQNATKIATSQPFIIRSQGDSGDTGGGDGSSDGNSGDNDGGTDTGGISLTTYMEGNRVRINWAGMPAHDFIGIVPIVENDWQSGMPGAGTDGSTSGKMGITIPNPINGTQYAVIFYKNSIRIAVSEPFLVN